MDKDLSYPPLGWRSQFGNVDWHLCTADTDAEAVDEPTSNEHTDVLGGARDDRPTNPDSTANLIGATAAKLISQVARDKRTDERTARHSRSDSTLNVGVGTGTFLIGISRELGAVGALVEVATILLCGQAASCQQVTERMSRTSLT